MDKNVLSFIRANHVMVISTSVGDMSWCASVFYAFDDEELSLVFLSSNKTKHMRDISVNNFISGAISSQESNIASIIGIQFTGMVISDGENEMRELYYRRFPFARMYPSGIYKVILNSVKYTSNIAIFGKKIHWNRDI